MKEKDIQNIFGHINKEFGVFELKLCKTKSIRFDAVKEHQVEALLKASSNEGLYYKINDAPYSMKFTNKKPFDCFLLKNIPAFVVICFYEPRKYKIFHYIRIEKFLKEKEISNRKSLTEIISAKISDRIFEV